MQNFTHRFAQISQIKVCVICQICGRKKVLAHRLVALVVLFALLSAVAPANAGEEGAGAASFESLSAEYDNAVRPLLARFCLDCHSTEAKEGELDLERFAGLNEIRQAPQGWQRVVEMLDSGEMPPEDAEQPAADEKKLLRDWARRYLDAEARASAGDPGPVVLRRLNNAEYTYTIQDLTGLELQPAREFPVDGAAGEGFTNTGNALVMSPALVQKYFDAGKEIAAHAVLLPGGFRFSPGTTRRDWSDEIVAQIREIYARHTTGNADVSQLDQWSVPDPSKSTDNDGRVDIRPYIAVLLRERDSLLANDIVMTDVASRTRLNEKYLRLLGHMLTFGKPGSLLLDRIRQQWREANADGADKIAAEVRAWQSQLWKFNPVGHLGLVQPWQQPVSALGDAQHLRLKIEPPAGADEVVLYLVAGTAGDGSEGDTVVWRRPRLERAGAAPLMLRDVRGVTTALARLRGEMFAQTSKYLAAALDARTSGSNQDVARLAAEHNVDPLVLRAWLAYLGISVGDEVLIKEYLPAPLSNVGGHSFVRGWMLPGVGDLTLVSNSSDEKVHIPGDLNGHAVAVHPRPERFVAAGWKSPIEGRVRLAPRVQHAHPVCGNGVSWSIELRRGTQRRVLQNGNVDLGGQAAVEPWELDVQRGDLLSLVIGPRDADHVCDLTEIDLAVAEIGGAGREWSLAGDCAGDIDAGNPHADRLGNKDVWHFYTGRLDGSEDATRVPRGSILARWLDATESAQAQQLAAQLEVLLSNPLTDATPEADAGVHRLLTGLQGPLLGGIDSAALAASATPAELEQATFGLEPQLFKQAPGTGATTEDLVVSAPSVIELRLPAELVAGSELVVSGVLLDERSEGSVQLRLMTERPLDADTLFAGVPVIVRPGSAAAARFEQAFADFRALFPAALCYARIVPVDETVTLMLYHREDEHLKRLMLDGHEATELDRLWDELHYVSQDALRIQVALEQILEFSTQDADPRKFDPVLKPIAEGAAQFERRLVETEPAQVAALVDFASRAYRRPLSASEVKDLRRLHEVLRGADIPHEEAFRLMLARIFTSPEFLYRLEQPSAGIAATPVSDTELANRLSYFLWSSLPDDSLRTAAEGGRLRDPAVMVAQTRRMLADDRVRRLAVEFAAQWLHVRDFDQVAEKSESHFPTFADLRDDMYEETIRFFTDLFQHDGSVLGIVDADHTFLNGPLAEHYGIPGVMGDDWQRVDGTRAHWRGGILTQATTLANQSGASRTSPILRGDWVSETLLGERLPRPPKDVPVLPETVPADLSERQLIEQHTSVAACAKCHARIDPYGFALENFDAIGRFRQSDASGRPIDTQTKLADGTPIAGLDGLRNYLLTTRRSAFVHQFCKKLLGYALGRGVQLSDEPLLDEMQAALAAGDYRFSIAVEKIVLSPQFRMIRGRDRLDDNLASADDSASEDTTGQPTP